jgi:protein TonB
MWATARDTAAVSSAAISCLRWLTAVICVLAVHAGGVWALVSWPVDTTSNATAGAFAVELAPEIYVGASKETTERAATPEREAKHAAPPTPLTAPPSPLAPEPVVAAAPRQTPEPEKDREKEPEKKKVKPDETAKAEPTPRQESLEVTKAPTAGFSSLAARAQAAWREDLAKHIERHQNYPKAAIARHLHGHVKLRFSIDRAGRVLVAQVVESSGSQLLDAEAMAMLKKAAPLPIPPPETPGASLTDLELPIDFKL